MVTEPGICHPVAERCSEGLRKHDGRPVKCLDFRRGNGFDRDGAE